VKIVVLLIKELRTNTTKCDARTYDHNDVALRVRVVRLRVKAANSWKTRREAFWSTDCDALAPTPSLSLLFCLAAKRYIKFAVPICTLTALPQNPSEVLRTSNTEIRCVKYKWCSSQFTPKIVDKLVPCRQLAQLPPGSSQFSI
jgi:hypothetical protein